MRAFLSVLGYLAIGIIVARIANHILGGGLPDPFAFLAVVLWPMFIVVAGLGYLVRL